MSAPAITAADIRNRLGADSTDITADQATLYIAFADAWSDKVIANNGTTAASLDATQTALIKQAKIDVAAKAALTGFALDSGGFDVGPIKIKEMTAKDRLDLMEFLEGEKDSCLNLINFFEVAPYVSGSGGDNYVPDGEDLTNIDFGETEDYPFSTMG